MITDGGRILNPSRPNGMDSFSLAGIFENYEI